MKRLLAYLFGAALFAAEGCSKLIGAIFFLLAMFLLFWWNSCTCISWAPWGCA